MSQLTDFYTDEGTDSEGRTLAEIWEFTDEQLDAAHDYIQWLFPLAEESAFNPDAPLVTEEDRELFRANPRLWQSLRVSLAVFLRFMGLGITPPGQPAVVVRDKRFGDREGLWKYPNHNWLRVTRVLKSLRLLGLEEEAQAFWKAIQELRAEGYGSENSFLYWQEAMA